MAYLGGLHFWWPKITGRMYPEVLGARRGHHDLLRLQPDVLSAVHPRLSRHAAPLPRLSARIPGLNVLSSAGASILAVGYLLPLFYLGWSLFWGPAERAPNPWHATASSGRRLAAAQAQLRRDPRGAARSLTCIAARSGPAECLRRTPAFQYATLAQQHDARSSACGRSLRPRCCSSAD